MGDHLNAVKHVPMNGHIHRTSMASFIEKDVILLIGFYEEIYSAKVSLPL